MTLPTHGVDGINKFYVSVLKAALFIFLFRFFSVVERWSVD